MSFPRDLWVDIPGQGSAKINAAFNGGPQLLVETIKQDFNIPISHYLEVDFAGFRDIVNAIGTVPVYFPTPASDKYKRARHPDRGLSQAQRRPGARVRALARLRVRRQNGEWQDGTASTSAASRASSTSSARSRTRP